MKVHTECAQFGTKTTRPEAGSRTASLNFSLLGVMGVAEMSTQAKVEVLALKVPTHMAVEGARTTRPEVGSYTAP